MDQQVSQLYHFARFDDEASMQALERLLLGRELPLQAVADLGDPFDALEFATFDPTEDGLRRIIRELVEQAHPGIEPTRKAMEVAKMLKLGYQGNTELMKAVFDRFTTHVRQRLGVFRFSATAENPLLWQYWAGGHTGVCVGFQPGAVLSQARPVQYQDERPAIAVAGAFTGEETLPALLTKGSAWAHEQEWRLYRLPAQGGPGAIAYEANEVFGVLIGSAMPVAKRRDLQALLARMPFSVPVWRATVEPQGFGLEMVSQG